MPDLQLLLALAAAAALGAALQWGFVPVEEAVAVVPGLGLVLVSRTRWRGGRSRLVPAEQIDTVVINEVRLPSQLNASSMQLSRGLISHSASSTLQQAMANA